MANKKEGIAIKKGVRISAPYKNIQSISLYDNGIMWRQLKESSVNIPTIYKESYRSYAKNLLAKAVPGS